MTQHLPGPSESVLPALSIVEDVDKRENSVALPGISRGPSLHDCQIFIQ